MSSQSILLELHAIVEARWPGRFKAPSAEAALVASGLLDSIETMELVIDMERHFRVALPDEDLSDANFATFGAAAALVERRRNASA